jgi:hypothetical protein
MNVMHAFPSGMAGTRPGVAWEATCIASVFQIMVIQRILRHANVSTTLTYYIKTAADDVRKAMTTLENRIYGGSADRIGHCADPGRQNAGRSFHRTVEPK